MSGIANFEDIAIYGTIVSTTMVSMALMLYIIRDRTKSKYDEIEKRAILSAYRESYERDIAELSKRMTSTPSRWEDVNHLVAYAQNNQILNDDDDCDEFLRGMGIDRSQIKVDKKQIFVLTPFAEREMDTYIAIKSVCVTNGFNCSRGDEDQFSGDILSHIVKMILSSRIVIANISSRNPNVFYELGISHALGKSTILVDRKGGGSPFNVQSKRTIFFDSFDELEDRLKEALFKALINQDT